MKNNKIKLICMAILVIILVLAGTTIYKYYQTPAIIEGYINQGIIEYKFNQLPVEYQDILIKVQDPGFYLHKGVDFNTPGVGWTTITQSLAKFLYFKNFQPGWRKIPQTCYARFALQPRVTKEEQLDLFINIIGFGNETKGILSASQYYFGKKPDELTRDEYISLVASINNPNMLNPRENPNANKERVRKIKKYLSGEYVPKSVFDNNYEDA